MPDQIKTTNPWHIATWVVQAALAGLFGFAGFTKATTPLDALAAQPNMGWAAEVGPEMVLFIGVSELLGAVGLILPSLLRIQPRLSGYAGAGLALIMVMAMMFHILLKEYNSVGLNLLLGAAGIFVAWGRLSKAPIEPKA